MRTVLLTSLLFIWSISSACDDHYGTCKIEDWKWRKSSPGTLILEGVTSCNEGRIHVRLYRGTSFLGISRGYVRGHTFKLLAENMPTNLKTLTIKYAIEP